MRLLIVNGHGDDTTVGGTERGIALVVEGLRARGFEISLLRAFPGGGSIAEQTILYRIDWRENNLQRLANQVADVLSRPSRALALAVERHRPDVIHTHNLIGIGTGVWEVCRRAGIPVVHTVHDYHLLCPRVTLMRRDGTSCEPSPLFCGFRQRRLARWSRGVGDVIGCSQYVLDAHRGIFDHARQHVIRNAMVPFLFGKLKPPASPPRTLGYIGSLDQVKGVRSLLEAAPKLGELGYQLYLAGAGRIQGEVIAATERLPNVRYAGLVAGEVKEAFFAACDVGVIPSIWAEPGGPSHVMVEWLAAGRPVLLSARGGLGEVIDWYPGSIPIEPTPEGIVGAVYELADPARWAETLAAIRPPAWQQTATSWVDEHEEIYRSLSPKSGNAR